MQWSTAATCRFVVVGCIYSRCTNGAGYRELSICVLGSYPLSFWSSRSDHLDLGLCKKEGRF
jgi:hypothetical protein